MLLPLWQNQQAASSDQIYVPLLVNTNVLPSHTLIEAILPPLLVNTNVLPSHTLIEAILPETIQFPLLDNQNVLPLHFLYSIADMVLLKPDLSDSHPATTAEYRRHGYINNGWDRLIRWNGFDATTVLAGIVPPSNEQDSWQPLPATAPGRSTVGLHVFRYRYQDSTTGYVSNPSEEREFIIPAGGEELTFQIGPPIPLLNPVLGLTFTATTIQDLDGGDFAAAGYQAGDSIRIQNATDPANNGLWGPITAVLGDTITIASASFVPTVGDLAATIDALTTRIPTSSDPKVDSIVLEATTVDDAAAAWFFATSVVVPLNTEIVFDIPDNELEVSFLPWPDYGHDLPPVAKHILSHRERIWLFGQVVHTRGTIDLTAGAKEVDENAFCDWRASALGDSVNLPQTEFKTVTWHLAVAGVPGTYEVETYDSVLNQLVLVGDWIGPPLVGASYQLFSRANVISVSRPGFPESFEPLEFINGPNGEGAGDLTAGVGYGTSVLFFTPNGMHKLVWEQDPLVDGAQFPLSNKYGALNQRVVLEVEGTVYSMDKRGWTAWRGIAPALISRPIDGLRGQIDYNQSENFHVAWYPEIRAVRWFVSYQGDVQPKNYVQFDVDTQTWSTGRYLQAISDSQAGTTLEGLRTFLGDENGHLWVADEGTADGLPGNTSHHLVAGVASTDTVIDLTPVDLFLPIALTGVQGTFAYFPTTQEARLIIANTESQITLDTPLSAAPLTDEPVWIGVIPTKLRSKAFKASDLGQKHKNKFLWLEFTPTPNQRTLQVRLYQDLDPAPKAWATYDPLNPASPRVRSTPPSVEFPGTNPLYPATDWLLDMAEQDGSIKLPIGSEFHRYTEFEFEILEPDAPIEIVSFQIDTQDSLEDEQ